MKDDEPCCPAAAAHRVSRIWVGGNEVGIIEMDRVIEEVHSMGLDDDALADALLKRAMIYNYVPPKAIDGYRAGLLAEYLRIHPRGGR